MSVGIVDKSTGERIPTAGNPLDKVGDLTNLTTTAKNNAVSAINEVNAGLATKQDTLTFDSVPTDGSTNPVESNGVFDALATKANATDVSTALALKQNATDNNLDTDAKTIVGAINEHEGDVESLKSGLTNLDNEVNGDATVYPYADVITINDAVPANLADCSVKVEPVQDLHGYDHPWVGGAERNKCESFVATSATEQYVVALYIETELQASTQYAISFDDIANNKYYANENVFTRVVAITTVNGRNSIIVTTRDNLAKSSATYEDGKGWICLKNQFAQAQTPDIDRVQIETGSSATDYAPYSNICPISGHTEAVVTRDGKNLCEPTAYVSDDADGTTYTDVSYDIAITKSITLSAGTYKFSAKLLSRPNADRSLAFGTSQYSGQLWSLSHLEQKTVGVVYSQTVTLESETTFRGYLYGTGGGTFKIQMQIERGDTVTEYKQFVAPQQYTLALGDTIYGGEVDFDTGVMNITKVLKTYTGASGESWEESATPNAYYIGIGDAKAPSNNFLCNIGKQAASLNNTGDCIISALQNFAIKTIYTTLSDWLTYLASNHLQVCYELATPTTIQLTPQQIQLLKGHNTLYASTGQISVTVNGVSGAIGSVQEQVNELAEDVALKQNATDNNLTTISKTIVGGINELKSGLTNKQDVDRRDTILGQSTIDITLGAYNSAEINLFNPSMHETLYVYVGGSAIDRVDGASVFTTSVSGKTLTITNPYSTNVRVFIRIL